MACTCRKNDINSELSLERREIYPIHTCLFCGEKHISMISSIAANNMLKPITRQLILGELECAKRHFNIAYPELTEKIEDIILLISTRKASFNQEQPVTNNFIDLLSLLKEYKNNVTSTDSNGSEYNYFELNTYKENPLTGELLFSTAWRLSKECGYEGINKYTIIGDLSLSQQHFYRFNYNLSEKIRNLRHLIQRNELSEADINWLIVAQNIDAAITPKIDTIIDTYGSNMWDKEQISV